ncbi:MAG TPA: hypothetical protein PKL52_07380 [Tenuifilaceae bacterium]|nr:hypothetical protein [Tenuifilaceae bacterium]
MDEKINSIEESFQIINRIIEDEKVRLNENGFIYLFWGWLVIFCSSMEYVLMFSGVRHHYYIWFVMILGGVFTGIYFGYKKGGAPMPLTGKVLAYIWIFIGLNIFAFAFLFPIPAGSLLIFFILAMLGVGTIISGALIRFPWLVYGGIICNALAFVTILVPSLYWNAITIVAIIFADIIPGYMLRAKYRKQNVR